MPTYTWTLNRTKLTASILRKLGVLGNGSSAEPDDAAVVAEAIDARLKELQTLGVLWWNVSGAQTTVPLVGGTATATISASDYLLPVTMMLTVGSEQKKLNIIGHAQYQEIPNKAETGDPEVVFISGATCRFWPVPRADGSAKLTYQAIAEDSVANSTVDVQTSMLRAFSEVIAADLVNEFNPPQDRASRLLAGRPEALRTLRMLKREVIDSATVAPEWL